MNHQRSQQQTSLTAFPGRRSQSSSDVPMPMDTGLEGDVLGALMRTPDARRFVLMLDEGCFADPVHSLLFSAIQKLAMKGKSTSVAVLASQLGPSQLESLGGRAFLEGLIADSEGLETVLAETIANLRSLSNRREAIRAAQELIAKAVNPETSPEEAMSFCARRLQTGMAKGGSAEMRTKREVAAVAIDERLNAGPAITTGIVGLDQLILGGLRPRQFIVIEGDFGRGKTAIGATVSDNLNAQGVPNLYATLESTAEEIEMRMVARRLGLRMSWTFDETHPGFEKLRKNRDTYVNEIPDFTAYVELRRPSIDRLHREILKAKALYGTRVVILDYFQCIGGFEKGMKEDTFWFDMGEALRDIAKDEDLAIVVLAQAVKKTEEALRQTSTLLLRLIRDVNDDAMHFEIHKTNDSPYGCTDRSATPLIVLDPAGPHVRDSNAEDATRAAQRDGSNNEGGAKA